MKGNYDYPKQHFKQINWSIMDIDINDIINEVSRQFPKELTICIQAVQIRKLQEQAGASHEHDADVGDPTD